MRAWRLTRGASRLILSEVEEMPLGRGEVRVAVTASGLCHTDVAHLADHGARLPRDTMTLGHESAGSVVEVGEEVEGWRVGDRVTVQASTSGPGSARDGGYAETVVARKEELVALPSAVSDAVGALAADAGQTSFRAVVTQGGVRPGMRVGILGLGGLGLLGARIAVLHGAEVYGADIRSDVFDLAREHGVLECASSLTSFADRDLDLIVDFAGMNTTSSAFQTIRRGGRVVQVGIGRREAMIRLDDVLLKELEYVGSVTGSREDLVGFLDLVAQGRIEPHVEEIAFESIGDGLDRLAQGAVSGRLVATLTP